jgi:hypothetical protein
MGEGQASKEGSEYLSPDRSKRVGLRINLPTGACLEPFLQIWSSRTSCLQPWEFMVIHRQMEGLRLNSFGGSGRRKRNIDPS